MTTMLERAADRRRRRGARAYRAGAAAEEQVARFLERRGCAVVERRWRGAGGELDLVVRDGASTVFVEVKAGPDHATAALRVGPRERARILAAAEEYMGTLPDGALSEVRLDVALVDAGGRIEVLRNAIATDG